MIRVDYFFVVFVVTHTSFFNDGLILKLHRNSEPGVHNSVAGSLYIEIEGQGFKSALYREEILENLKQTITIIHTKTQKTIKHRTACNQIVHAYTKIRTFSNILYCP
jgi:hypothetical protein